MLYIFYSALGCVYVSLGFLSFSHSFIILGCLENKLQLALKNINNYIYKTQLRSQKHPKMKKIINSKCYVNMP
jgi:hypothetical protein